MPNDLRYLTEPSAEDQSNGKHTIQWIFMMVEAIILVIDQEIYLDTCLNINNKKNIWLQTWKRGAC